MGEQLTDAVIFDPLEAGFTDSPYE